MIVFLKYGCFLLLVSTLISCRETFDEELPHTKVNTLVVEGEINDGPGPYRVKLTRSVYFTSNDKVMAGKSEIYVVDDLNNRYDFKEKEAGFYYSDSASFKGKIGRTYTLFINTNDNLSYKSNPCTLGSPGRLDSVFFSSPTTSGFQINGDISFNTNQEMRMKIDASIAIGNTIDSMHIIYSKSALSKCDSIIHKITTYYPAINSLNYIPVLKANTDYIDGSKIKNIPFFYFNYPIPKADTSRSNHNVVKDKNSRVSYYSGSRFILIINASTVSNETFNYYNDLITQISGKNVFFEPTPVQLAGNITCINDKSKSVYGYFQANAVVKKYFRYIEWSNKLKEINRIPDIDVERIDSIVTDNSLVVIHW